MVVNTLTEEKDIMIDVGDVKMAAMLEWLDDEHPEWESFVLVFTNPRKRRVVP
jgi:hypothetical protein